MAIDVDGYFNDEVYNGLGLNDLITRDEFDLFSSKKINEISKDYISRNGDSSCFSFFKNIIKKNSFENKLKDKLNCLYFDRFDQFEAANYVINQDQLAQDKEGREKYDLKEYLTGIKDSSKASEKERSAAGEKLWKRVAELHRIYKFNPIKDNQPASAKEEIPPSNLRENPLNSQRGSLSLRNNQDVVEVNRSNPAFVDVPLSSSRQDEIPFKENQPDSGFESIALSNSKEYQNDPQLNVDDGCGRLLEDDEKDSGVVGLGSSNLSDYTFCRLHKIIDSILGDKGKIQDVMNNIIKSSSSLSKEDLIKGLESLRKALDIDPSEITKVRTEKITFYVSNRGIYLHLNRTSFNRDVNLNDKINQRNIGYLIFISDSEVKRMVCKTIPRQSNQFKRRMHELDIAKKLTDMPGFPQVEQAFIANSSKNKGSNGVQKFYIFEQTLEGSDLSKFIQNESIEADGKKQIMLKLLNILNRMHKKGVVHGDVKPENILVSRSQTTGEYEVLVFDFDLSFDIREVKDMNDGFGTLKYAAPEMLDQSRQFKKYGQVPAKHCSPALDVYSLGATFRCLLGNNRAGKRLKQLLSGMLEVNPEKRLKISEALALCKDIPSSEFR